MDNWDEDRAIFCKVFVNADVARSDLVDTIAHALDGRIKPLNTVAGDTWEIDVRRNDEHDAERSKDQENGFLFFPYYLDVVARRGRDRQAQIALVSRLLERLWERGYGAVAACDFEEELPRKGVGLRE